MKLSNENLLKFLGFNTQGDLGPWTFYTSKRKGLVWFQKSPPLEPPSYLQIHQRNLFRVAAQLWRALLPTERDDWLDAAEIAGLAIHGYNVFVHAVVTQETGFIATLERLSGRQLVIPL